METMPSGARPVRSRDRRGRSRAIKESLRELGIQLSLLNHSVGGRLDLRGTDLECLDLIGREGRLEQGGWIARERDPSDRRAVLVQAVRGRVAEVARLYLVDSGMNEALDQILAGYADEELELVARFLRSTAAASGAAAKQLADA